MQIKPKSPDLFFVLLLLFVCFAMYIPLGASFSPVNDAWVSLSVDYSSHGASLFSLEWLIEKQRYFRMIPFVVNSYFDVEGFYVLKLILFFITLFTMVGVYKVFSLFCKWYIAFALSAIFIVFPFDHTLFWLGAFGVNISLCFFVWSTYFLLLYFVASSRALYLFLGCFFFFVSNLTYPGPVLILPALFLLFAFFFFRSFVRNFRVFSLIALSYLFSLLPFFLGLIYSTGRNSNVASYDLSLALEGFSSAIKKTYFDSFLVVSDMNSIFPILFSLMLFASFFVFRSISFQGENSLSRNYGFALALVVAVFVAGYLPYSLSDIRFNSGRVLLFSRFSFVILLAVFFTYIDSKIKFGELCVSLIFALIFSAFFSSKIDLANRYSDTSAEVRFFVSEVSKLVPGYSGDGKFFIYVDKGKVKPPSMLINRPAPVLRYLYSDPNLLAISGNRYNLRRGVVKYNSEQNVLQRNKLALSPKHVVALKYIPGVKVELLDSISIISEDGKSENSVYFPNNSNLIVDQPPTIRQSWFIENL